MGNQDQLDDRIKKRRRSERRKAAKKLEYARNNPFDHRGEKSRLIVSIVSLALIALFVYLLRVKEF